MLDPEQRTIGRRLFELASIAICTVTFLFTALSVLMVVVGRQGVADRDYIEYWASGQQLVHHRNPYDATAILKLERSAGFESGIPAMVMGNPPPALLITYPLGFIGPKYGQLLWMLLLLGSLVLSVHLLADALKVRDSYIKLLGYSFAPALTCIAAGQMALFVLLGVAVFLHSYRKRSFLAGAALWLCLLKPQLFLPFGLVLGVWAITNRRLAMCIGLSTSVGVSLALIWSLDPHCWSEYGDMMKLLRYDRVSFPCLSIVLRNAVGGSPFVQYVPAVVGCIWSLVYFWRHRTNWDWLEHGSPLLLVSLLVPPYTWLVDQCVALPALLRGLSLVQSRSLIAVLALLSAIIETGQFVGLELLHSNLYLWTAPAWLLWYIVACRPAPNNERPDAHNFRVGLTESVCK